jgi:hypothetical protein
MRENPLKTPFFGKNPLFWGFSWFWPILGILTNFEESSDFGGAWKFAVSSKSSNAWRRDQTEGMCVKKTHTLQGRALELYSEWRSLAGADNFYIPSLWRWYSGLSCTSRCMKGTGVYDCVLFEREWLFIIWGRIRLSPCLQSNKISSNDVLLSYFSVFSNVLWCCSFASFWS